MRQLTRLLAPLRVSVIFTPVVCNAFNTCPTFALFFFCLRTAQAPEEKGMQRCWSPSVEGDGSFQIVSAFVVAPTLTADEIHAGAEIPSVCRSLPDAMIVGIPAARSLSIWPLMEGKSASQSA